MLQTGLIGASVDYSISPELFSVFFKEADIKADYGIFNLADDELNDFLEMHLSESNTLGFNITIPYKSLIMPYLDFTDQSAKIIGAVNCIYKNAGNWVGTNTDFQAFASTIESLHLVFKSALILGVGGAARAVCHAIKNTLQLKPFVWARDPFKLDDFIKETGADYWKGNDVELIINCTPVGTKGNSEDLSDEIISKIKSAKLYYDLVYIPSETKLMHEARTNGIKTMNGLSMLIEQASLSAEKWFGINFSQNLVGQFNEKYSSL